MERKRVEIDYEGLYLIGSIVIGDTEGDASFPCGRRVIPAYAEDLEVMVNGSDITKYLSTTYYDRFCMKLVQSLR